MVQRNLSDKLEGQFICFTEDDTDLHKGIIVKPLYKGLHGWWNKLYLFKKGLFNDDDQIFYIDLDTIISGGLDEFIKCRSKFAILRDFYRPDGYGSGVMVWQPKYCYHIWDSFLEAGKPEIDGGDQAWIEKQINDADILQDLYPNMFVSYKVHARDYIPRGANVICFHGIPKPHHIKTGYVPHVWKIGGGTSADLKMVCNNSDKQRAKNVRAALKRNFKMLTRQKPHERHAVIVGGGPSINDYTKELLMRKREGQKMFALNNAAKWLDEHGIYADAHVLLDSREENNKFVPAKYDYSIEYYYASQCHPSVFRKIRNAIKSHKVYLWHNYEQGMDSLTGTGDGYHGPSSTVGLKAMLIAYILGYRKIHLYGMDSSYRGDAHHAFPQKINDDQKVLEVTVHGVNFKTSPWMVAQVNDFQEVAAYLIDRGCTITVHGDGLLPFVANSISTTKELS